MRVEELRDPARAVVGQVHDHAPGPDVRVVHAETGDRLEDVEDQLALAEPVQHHRDRPELHAAGCHPDQVRGDPVQLAEEHAEDLGAWRRFDPEQPLDRQAVRQLVEERREVVRARDVGDTLHPRPVLRVLLDAGVEVADDRLAPDHGLAVELQEQAEHPVGRGVLRTHVDDHRLLTDLAGGVVADLRTMASELVASGTHLLTGRHHGIVRSSTGGMNAPWYCVPTPPSSSSFRSGCPSQSSGSRIRSRSG